MGLFDWIRGGQPSAPTVPEVTFTPPAGSKPFGVDKPISECNDEDIQASREALWEAGASRIKGWRYDAGGDHRSTLFELAVDGMEAATRDALPPVPEELKLAQQNPQARRRLRVVGRGPWLAASLSWLQRGCCVKGQSLYRSRM